MNPPKTACCAIVSAIAASDGVGALEGGADPDGEAVEMDAEFSRLAGALTGGCGSGIADLGDDTADELNEDAEARGTAVTNAAADREVGLLFKVADVPIALERCCWSDAALVSMRRPTLASFRAAFAMSIVCA
jgi:hypothetical protein